CLPQRPSQLRDLGGRIDVALEENEAPWIGLTQERALFRRQRRARKTGDESARCHGRGLPRALCKGQARFKQNSVGRDHTLAAGGLVAGAELDRLLRRGERPHHGAVEYAFAAEISLADDRLPVPELVRELGLQAAVRGLRLRLSLLRGELHHVPGTRIGV